MPLKEERHRRIVAAVHENQEVTVADLSRTFGVSDVTIRRDLRELAARGMLRRTHGGAVTAAPAPPQSPVIQRMTQDERCKRAIGRAAAALVSDGESVFIGSGSTTCYVARYLVGRNNLTVVTNALTVAMELATAEQITVVVTGGVLRASELSLIGHITSQALREVRANKIIMGIPAIDLEDGLTNDYLPEVITDRTIIEMASELIVVVDHSKFGRVGSAYLAPATRVTTLVTDWETDPDLLRHYEGLGIRVVVADPEGEREQ